MKLYIVNHLASLKNVLAVVTAEDSLLLTEEGVYAAIMKKYTVILPEISCKQIFGLQEDALARGVCGNEIYGIHWIDINGFILLTESHSNIVSWS